MTKHLNILKAVLIDGSFRCTKVHVPAKVFSQLEKSWQQSIDYSFFMFLASIMAGAVLSNLLPAASMLLQSLVMQSADGCLHRAFQTSSFTQNWVYLWSVQPVSVCRCFVTAGRRKDVPPVKWHFTATGNTVTSHQRRSVLAIGAKCHQPVNPRPEKSRDLKHFFLLWSWR